MSHDNHDLVSPLIGRTQDLDHLWDLLSARSTLMIGPRRVGKTEVLRSMVQCPRDGWLAVRADVGHARTVAEGVALVTQALVEAGLGPYAGDQALGRVQALNVAGVAGLTLTGQQSSEPWNALDAAVRDAAARAGARRLLIALDEVPWWLDEIGRTEGAPGVRAALAALRWLRQRDANQGRVRWLLTGSIGLAGIAQDVGASAEINDLTPGYDLRPLDRASGGSLFETDLADRQRSCRADAADHAWHLAGGYPHWIKLLAERAATGLTVVTPAQVDAAAEDLLVPRLRNLFADEGHEHLVRRHGPQRAARLMQVLAAAAHAPTVPVSAVLSSVMTSEAGLSRRDAEEAMYRLVDEYYIDVANDQVRFLLPLFRLWWLRYGRPE